MDYEARQIKVTRAKGLTLVELMVTIAIAAILTAIAAPNFTPLIKNNRFAAQKNELQSALNLARSEAVKRNGTVSVCISNNGSGCSGHSNHFHHGWLVFADANADGEVNGGDVILRAYNEAFGRMKILFSRGEYVTYGSDGLVVVGGDSHFEFCENYDGENYGGIIISPTGRPRHAVDSDSNGILEDSDGSDFDC